MRTFNHTTLIAGLMIVLVWASTSHAIVTPNRFHEFPIPGSVYESLGGTSFPNSTVPVEILSMDLVGLASPGDSVALPLPGETFQVDSFFDVFTELRVGPNIFMVDSFFDVTFEISGRSAAGSWDTEIVAMSLKGEVGGIPVEIRESPRMKSMGQHRIGVLNDHAFHVNSFFDIYTELSIGGGPFIPAASSMPLQLTRIVPEPSGALLMLFGLVGQGIAVRRRRSSARVG